MELITLPKPHGYLIWRGKQTAIASDKPYPVDTPLYITSGSEAFGEAVLSQPAQVTLSEFERDEWAQKHCTWPEERRKYWPEADTLYIQSIKEFTGFSEPRPVIEGEVKEYSPTKYESEIITLSQKLPRFITLEEEAVIFTSGGFAALPEIKGNEELREALSIYGKETRFVGQKRNLALPLYSLALVRQPAFRFERILGRVMSAQKAHSGVMVALMLPATAAAKLALSQEALPEGAVAVPPEELHLTLMYLGKADELGDRELIERILSTYAADQVPLTGKVNGIGRFGAVESDGTNAFYASFDARELPAFRQTLVSRLKEAGIDSPSTHGFTPHITLGWLPEGVAMPDINLPDIEMSFNELTLAWGDEHLSYPLAAETPTARTQAGVKKKEAEVMPEEMAPKETSSKEESLQARVDRIRSGFQARFCDNSGDYYNNPWVIDVFENYVIADWQGEKYQVLFAETEKGELVFAPRLDWIPVTVSYVPDVQAMKAVTKTENGMAFSRSAYLYAPGEEVSEWKLRIEAEPGQVTKAQLGAAAAALSSGGFRGQQVDLSAEEKKTAARKLIGEYRKLEVADDEIPDHLWSTAGMKPAEKGEPAAKAGRRLGGRWMDKLRAAKDALMELATWAEYADREAEESEAETATRRASPTAGTQAPQAEDMAMLAMLKGSSGVAVKMVNGEPWHCSWSSNAFQDRDEEIFSLKSLEQYVSENEENEVKGYFNLWHIKNTDFAEKRYQAVIGKFLFEAGPYLKDVKGQKALEFFKEYPNGHPDLAPEGWGASVEYRYLPEERKTKTYNWTWITRTSTLARGAAANIWTKSSQEIFTMTDEQKKAAVAMFGEDFTNQLIVQGEQKTKELEEAGVASKQVAAPEGKQSAQETKVPGEGQETPEVETPATPDPNAEAATGDTPTVTPQAQVLEALAAKMLSGMNETFAPVLNEIKEGLTRLEDRVGQLEQDQAIKQKTEMPRFFFGQMRASEAQQTVVTEGDALKDRKPAEAAAKTDGSMASAYFPAKR